VIGLGLMKQERESRKSSPSRVMKSAPLNLPPSGASFYRRELI